MGRRNGTTPSVHQTLPSSPPTHIHTHTEMDGYTWKWGWKITGRPEEEKRSEIDVPPSLLCRSSVPRPTLIITAVDPWAWCVPPTSLIKRHIFIKRRAGGSQWELLHMDSFQKKCYDSFEMFLWKHCLDGWMISLPFRYPLTVFVCQKISTQSLEYLPQCLYFTSVREVYLMWVVDYMVSGLAKEDW